MELHELIGKLQELIVEDDDGSDIAHAEVVTDGDGVAVVYDRATNTVFLS